MEETEKTDIAIFNNTKIQKLVKKEIEEKKLGSVIFMSISQYLSILLSLSCPNCFDFNISNQTFYITVLGFGILLLHVFFVKHQHNI